MANYFPITNMSQSTVGTTTAAINEVRFGDGYSQRAASGINSVVRRYQLQWDNLTAANYATLISFLETILNTADIINWTAQGDIARNYSIDIKSGQIGKKCTSGNIYSVTCYIREEFDIV